MPSATPADQRPARVADAAQHRRRDRRQAGPQTELARRRAVVRGKDRRAQAGQRRQPARRPAAARAADRRPRGWSAPDRAPPRAAGGRCACCARNALTPTATSDAHHQHEHVLERERDARASPARPTAPGRASASSGMTTPLCSSMLCRLRWFGKSARHQIAACSRKNDRPTVAMSGPRLDRRRAETARNASRSMPTLSAAPRRRAEQRHRRAAQPGAAESAPSTVTPAHVATLATITVESAKTLPCARLICRATAYARLKPMAFSATTAPLVSP